MHPLVRNLYKRFMIIGQDYPHPGGLEHVRSKVKEAFFANKHLSDEAELKKAIHRGRYVCKEMIGFMQFKKYRAMRQRYTVTDEQKSQSQQELEWQSH